MHHKKAIVFVVLSTLFAVTHYIAVQNSLYWYFKWFDILMHFWGGGLIALGVHTFCGFSWIRCQANFVTLIIALLVITVTWEVFEWFAGLYAPVTYLIDTTKDMVVGFAGGLLAHFLLKRYTID